MRRGKSNPSLIVWARIVEGCLRHDFARDGSAAPYLSRIAALCQAAGARLTLVYIPASVAVHPAHLEAQRRIDPEGLAPLTAPAGPTHRAQQAHLRQLADALELPLIDLTDEFIDAEATRGRMFWPIDTHCNEAGYRLVAEACARAWEDRILPTIASTRADHPR
jgi:lysophospholipase L1-like esterase